MESGASVSSAGLGASVAGVFRATVKAEERATVKAKERATVSAEARTTVKAEYQSAAVANMVVHATVKPEDRATVGVGARTAFKAEDRSGVNASMVDCVVFKAQGRATVGAEACTTVIADNRSAVTACMVGRVTVKADECVTVSAGACTSVKAEDRSAVNANMDCGVIVKAEERATVSVEARTAVKGGDHSDASAGAYLSPSGTLVHGLDSSRGERGEDAGTLAGIGPLEATTEFTSMHLEGLSGEMSRKVSDRMRAIDANLNRYRRVVMCTDDVCTAAARHNERRQELCKMRGDARDLRTLARMDPPDEEREIGRRNLEECIATRLIARHSRHAENEAMQVELDREINVGGEAARTSDGLYSPEALQAEPVARRNDIGALARMDPQERETELSKRKRATKIATRTLHRHPRHAANEANITELGRNVMGSFAGRTSGGLYSAEATQEELRAQKEDARALAEMSAQQLARKVARMHRERRYTILAISRQRRWTRATLGVNASEEEMEIDRKILLGDINSGSFDVTKARLAKARRKSNVASALNGMDSQQRARGVARARRAVRVAATTIQRQQRKAMATINRANRARHSALVAIRRAARNTAIEARSTWKISGAGEVELHTGGKALPDGIGAGEVEQVDGVVPMDGIEAGGGVEQQTDGATLKDGTGAGEADGRAAVVGGAGANGLPAAKANTEAELRTQSVAEVAGVVSGDAVKIENKADLARARHAENLLTDGQLLMDGTGNIVVDRKTAVVCGIGVGGYPLVELKLEERREKAVIGAVERVARDAAGAERKPDHCARARHAEKKLLREDKKRRKASRAAKRIEKLEDRLIREKRKGEGLRPPVDIVEASVRLERGVVAGEGGEIQAPNTIQTARGLEALARSSRGPTGGSNAAGILTYTESAIIRGGSQA